MADNTQLNVGSGGDVIATDDISGVKHQLVKNEFGADGVATLVTATVGLPVNPVQETAGVGIGAIADTKATDSSSSWSGIALLKGILDKLIGTLSVNVTNTATSATKEHSQANDVNNHPMVAGYEAIAHGTNPTVVDAAEVTKGFANRAGVPFVIGGHPNVVTKTYITTAVQTDDDVLPAISTGLKYVITRLTITLDESTTVGVAVKLAFAGAALGSSGADGVTGIVVYHPGMVPGGGIQVGDGSGIIAVGGDGEELEITNEAPTGGTLAVSVSYYTVES